MVLIRAGALAVIVLAAGCNQSLFDNNGGGGKGDGGNGDGGGSGDAMIQTTCGANCLGDAAGDFDGTPTGTGNRWRYLDDNRNRTWAAMSPSGGALVGADPANKIGKCGAGEACTELPGALLVSTAGMTSGADPAISWTATTNTVINLTVRVKVPSTGMAHVVGLYRNSREDRLQYAPAGAGSLFETTLTVDALAGDRFYLTLVPAGAGTSDIGVQFYVNGTATSFPSSCQLALQFSSALANNMVDNACGTDVTSWDYNAAETPPTLGAGPFAEMGMAAAIPMDRYYESADVIVRTGDTTTQFWMRHDAFVPLYNAIPFSDLDLVDTDGGGLAIYIINQASPRILAETCTDGNTLASVFADAPYPNDHAWHFVRVVHANGQVRMCLDGARVASYVLPAGAMQSLYHPYVGKNVVWTPSGAFFIGAIDDVRVLTGALPCE